MTLIKILEYNPSHDELFPTWVYIFSSLKETKNIEIYTNYQNIKKGVNCFLNSKINIKNIYLVTHHGGLIWKIIKYPFRLPIEIIGRILRYPEPNDRFFFKSFICKKQNILIFNSIEPRFILKKAKYFSKKNYKVLVVLHNADIVLDPEYREFLLKDNVEVFALSEMVKDYLIDKGLKKIKLLAPIFFNYEKVENSNSKIVFTVQGNVSFNRRNYISLLNAVEKLIKEYKLNNLIIKILGNSNNHEGDLLKNEVSNKKLGKYFIFFDDTLEYKKYYSEIQDSDFLLVLQDMTSIIYLPYFRFKCSATINVSLGFNKITIMHDEQVRLNKFEDISISYVDGNLVDAMFSAINMSSQDKMRMESLISKMREELLEKTLYCVRKAVNILQE